MANFSKDAARRVVQASKRVEQAPRNQVDRPTAPRIVRGAKYAVVTTTITAISATTLGMGIAELQVLTYDSSSVATYHGTGISVIVYNGGAEVASGQLVIVAPVDEGYQVIVEYC